MILVGSKETLNDDLQCSVHDQEIAQEIFAGGTPIFLHLAENRKNNTGFIELVEEAKVDPTAAKILSLVREVNLEAAKESNLDDDGTFFFNRVDLEKGIFNGKCQDLGVHELGFFMNSPVVGSMNRIGYGNITWYGLPVYGYSWNYYKTDIDGNSLVSSNNLYWRVGLFLDSDSQFYVRIQSSQDDTFGTIYSDSGVTTNSSLSITEAQTEIISLLTNDNYAGYELADVTISGSNNSYTPYMFTSSVSLANLDYLYYKTDINGSSLYNNNLFWRIGIYSYTFTDSNQDETTQFYVRIQSSKDDTFEEIYRGATTNSSLSITEAQNEITSLLTNDNYAAYTKATVSIDSASKISITVS